jgi:hypothetical protein
VGARKTPNSIRYLQAVNHVLHRVSPRGMRVSAIALLVVGGLGSVAFWVGLVAWILGKGGFYLLDSVVGLGGTVVCGITANTLWQAAKLRDQG